MSGKYLHFAAGLVVGAALFSGGTALAAGILAEPSTQTFYLGDQQIRLEAYAIAGHNYVQLRDVGRAVDFNVTYDGTRNVVVIDPDTPYSEDAAAAKASETSQAGIDLEAARLKIVELTNAFRAENGVSELQTDELLMQAAQVRAEEMAAAGVYSHTRPDGQKFYTVTDVPYMAENIDCVPLLYLEQQSREIAETAVWSWELSEGHRATMLNGRLAQIGVGIAQGVEDHGLDCFYCVQLYVYEGYTVTWVDTIAEP